MKSKRNLCRLYKKRLPIALYVTPVIFAALNTTPARAEDKMPMIPTIKELRELRARKKAPPAEKVSPKQIEQYLRTHEGKTTKSSYLTGRTTPVDPTVEKPKEKFLLTSLYNSFTNQPDEALPPSKNVPEPGGVVWYAGSLFSPSPALSKKGMIEVEPYFFGGIPDGSYDGGANFQHEGKGGKHHPNSFTQSTLLEYAFTSRLTLAAHPNYSYSWGNGTHKSSSLHFNDLPFEFKYRFGHSYARQISLYAGAVAPTGGYSNLSNGQDSGGMGVWQARFGIVGQFKLPLGPYQQRFRVWASAEEPFTSTHIKNISAYGSKNGFRGTGHPGASGNEGMSWEVGLTERWIIGLDLYHIWSASNYYSGYQSQSLPGGMQTSQYTRSRKSGWSQGFHAVPALEYGFAANLSGVIGVDIVAIGRNTASTIKPEFALCYTY